MNLIKRIIRHMRLSFLASNSLYISAPPFIIFHVTSRCNLKCSHCFNWENLNTGDDLSLNEINELCQELGRIENLNLSGGEPFMRDEFTEICKTFIRINHVKQIYVTTNAYHTNKMEKQIKELLKEEDFQILVIEISLDGLSEYHNKLRGNQKAFEKAMESYKMLEKLQVEDQRLRVHAVSTITNDNIGDIRMLTNYLFENCAAIDHHGISILDSTFKDDSLHVPGIEECQRLVKYVETLWMSREEGRLGSVVGPMLQWVNLKTAECKTQFVPCTAGRLIGVIYPNGDVSVCEKHAPLGNIREKSFLNIWRSEKARILRKKIRAKQCYCTKDAFMWPGIVFQPLHLVRSLIGSRVSNRKIYGSKNDMSLTTKKPLEI